MRKRFSLIGLALLTSACSYAAPNAGEETVLVRHPRFFGHGGVGMEPVTTGTQIVAWSTSEVKVPVTPIAFDVGFDDIMPKDGIPLDFHTVVRMQVTNSPLLVRDWNGGASNDEGKPSYAWFWSNISPVYNNLVRQEVRRYEMAPLAFDGAAIDEIDHNVSRKLNEFIKANKMPVRLLSVTVGRATPPKEILEQRTETAAQQQRQKTMEAQQAAEVSRKGAEEARAAADNAYRQQMGLSPEQYVELRRIDMQRQACAQGTCVFGNATPIIGR